MSLDFWIYKNICGRIMVSLYWESVIDDNGK